VRNKTFTKLKYFEELKSESLAPSEIILNADLYEISIITAMYFSGIDMS